MADQQDFDNTVIWQVVFGIMMVATVTANLFILTAIATTPRLRITTNVYIGTLAVADLMVGLYRILTIIWLHENTHATFDESYWLCQGYAAFTFIACTASIITQLAISIDRFVYITHPFFYRRKITRQKVVIVMVAMCPVYIIHSSLLRFFETNSEAGCGVNIIFPKTPISTYVHFAIYIIISLTNFTLYYLIFTTASRQATAIDSQVVSTQISCDREKEKRRISRNVRFVKRMCLVWGLFSMLWTPYFVLSLVQIHTTIPTEVKLSCAVLGTSTSALNIVVYSKQDPHFRAAFKRILGKLMFNRNDSK